MTMPSLNGSRLRRALASTVSLIPGADIECRVIMDSWNLNELEVEPHAPQVLDSESEGRAIVINLPKGEQLQEHQVHERAWVLVVDGKVEIKTPDGDSATGPAGLLAIFDTKER